MYQKLIIDNLWDRLSCNQHPVTRNPYQGSANDSKVFLETASMTGNRHPVSGDQPKEFGFTLLEVMISLSIIAIVLIAVYKLHSQTVLMSQEAEFYAKAPFLASAKGSEIESVFPGMPGNDNGDFGEKYPGYSWRVEVNDVTSEALGEIADDIKQVDITVFFNGGERNYHLRTYRLIR